MRGWVGPQLNKFEQIFSNDHQMSVAKGWTKNREEGRGRSGIREGRSHDWYPAREVPCPIQGDASFAAGSKYSFFFLDMGFELHSGRDCDNGRDLAGIGGSDLEACRQWCAGNKQCGGFVQFIGSCWFKYSTCKDRIYTRTDPGGWTANTFVKITY